jgi:CRISPR-associated protein Cmr1
MPKLIRDRLVVPFVVTTPMFLGGAGVGGRPAASGFRVPSLRGALAFWFRALVGDGRDDPASLATLRSLQDRVFGSASGPQPRKHRRPIDIRPHMGTPQPASEGTIDVHRVFGEHDDLRWIGYLAGQGIWQPAGQNGPPRDRFVRAPILPGKVGALAIDLGEGYEHADAVAASLWCLMHLGGLGSRARRGFGGIRFDLTGLAAHCQRAVVRAAIRGDNPAVAHIVAGDLRALYEIPGPADDATPVYEVLSTHHWHPARAPATWGSLTDAMTAVGQELRALRTMEREYAEDYPPFRRHVTADYEQKIQPWLADGAIAGGLTAPAFGLPYQWVQFHDRASPIKVVACEPRRPSQLWLRFAEDANHRWTLLAHGFQTRFLPSPSVTIRRRGSPDATAALTDDDTWSEIRRALTHRWA